MINDLALHGKPRLSQTRRYLTYGDGTPFFYLADTWWFGATKRMPWRAFKQLADLRKRQGFTAIQIVVGYPPEIDPSSPHASNSGGWALSPDRSINHAYFVELDQKIKYLIELGIVPVIVGSWGYHIDLLGETAMVTIWQEIITRYGQYPTIWCLCGEVDLLAPPVFSKSRSNRSVYQLIKSWLHNYPPIIKLIKTLRRSPRVELSSRLEKWSRIAELIKISSSNLLTVHLHSSQSAAELFKQPAWLDINTIQSGHNHDGLGFMIKSAQDGQPLNLPFINLEPWYEGILNDFGPSDQRHAFWACVLSGAKGHSYGAHGIWQMSSLNDPFLTHWGISDWEQASGYEGAKHLGLAKRWLMKIPWWDLIPAQHRLIESASRATLNQPILSEIKDVLTLVYLPIDHQKTSYKIIKFKTNVTYKVDYISPITLRTKYTEIFRNQKTCTLKGSSSQDWIILISQKPLLLPRM